MLPDQNIVFGGVGAERTITLTPADNQSGSAMVIVSVSDGEEQVSDSFNVTVNAVNDPPIVSGIPEIVFNEDDSFKIDLDGYVWDADNDTTELVWSFEILTDSLLVGKTPDVRENEDVENVQSKSNHDKKGELNKAEKQNDVPKVCSVLGSSVPENDLIITIDSVTHVATFKSENDFFTSGIPVVFTATDPDDQSGMDTTLVIVEPVNDPPVFVRPFPFIFLVQGKYYSIPMSLPERLVHDVDNPDSTLIWSIEEHPYLVPSITEDSLTFYASFDWIGTDTLTVTVSDGELSAQTSLVVDVKPPLDETPPNMPVSFAATWEEGYVALNWEANTEDDIYSYFIFRTTDTTNVSDENRLCELLHPTTSYNDSTVELDTEYFYCIVATDTAHNVSQFSNMISVKKSSDVNQLFSKVPDQFELSQNYPNPFNPSTTIKFALPERAHVQITIYNIRGQVVAKILDSEKEAGYHTVLWDGKHIQSGVYLYRIQANDFMDVKKCLLIK